MPPGIVIVGASQAGVQTALSARTAGYSGSIMLLGEEDEPPYQRPPLSKGFLLDKPGQDKITLRGSKFYLDRGIELRLGERVSSLDCNAQILTTASGENIPYQGLGLTTGARVRQLPVPGAQADGVCYLRSAEDARNIKARLAQATCAVVIGGGFIGLEVAAALRTKELRVTVIEALDRLMARVVAPPVSSFYAEQHTEHGVRVLLATGVVEITTTGGRACGVRCSSGELIPADLVVIGIGVIPNSELAEQAGLKCSNGIEVDSSTRTSDPHIVAAGDCALHPNPYVSEPVRLESVQNASDQARVAGAVLAGIESHYHTVPWFWSEQYDLRLQMAGFSAGHDHYVIRGDPSASDFSVFYFRSGSLIGIDSVNRPVDHIAGRKLLGAGVAVSEAQAGDENLNLKSLLPS